MFCFTRGREWPVIIDRPFLVNIHNYNSVRIIHLSDSSSEGVVWDQWNTDSCSVSVKVAQPSVGCFHSPVEFSLFNSIYHVIFFGVSHSRHTPSMVFHDFLLPEAYHVNH